MIKLTSNVGQIQKMSLTFLLLAFVTNVFATDFYVYEGATYPHYTSISEAVNQAYNGDRVLIAEGLYLGDVEIGAKSITIAPMLLGGHYTVVGNFTMNQMGNLNGDREATIIGAIISVVGSGGNNNFNGFTCTVNLIDCQIGALTSSSPNVMLNLYYNQFTLQNSQISLYTFGDVIGNDFINNYSEPSGNKVSIRNLSKSANIVGHEIKILGNNFMNVSLDFACTTNGEWNWDLQKQATKLTISGNNFDWREPINNNYYSSQMIDMSSSDSHNIPFYIHNNTFRIGTNYGSWDNYGSIYLQNNELIEFRNNIYLVTVPEYPSSGDGIFRVSGGFNLNLSNNLFNIIPNIETGSISNLGGMWNSLSSSVDLTFEDNVFTSNISSTSTAEVDQNGGYIGSVYLDGGSGNIKYRDIDNTPSDFGTYGGPLCWQNIHGGSGPRIVSLNLPSSIMGLPGASYSFDGKAIISNE